MQGLLLCTILSFLSSEGVVMPPVVKMRGRPKGCKLTVVGLPIKKGTQNHRPKSFIDLHTSAKQEALEEKSNLLLYVNMSK